MLDPPLFLSPPSCLVISCPRGQAAVKGPLVHSASCRDVWVLGDEGFA